MKIKTLVLTILMLTIVLGVSDPSEAYDISTTATVQMDDMEPEINSSSLTITLDDDRDYIIPYGFTGESIGFTVDVTDNNGANDITEVILFISNDINIDNNEGISSIKILDKELDTSKNIPDNLKECVLQLKEYFQKKRTDFDLQLNPQGTDFQKKVWNELQQIPYGKTTTYLKQKGVNIK